LIDGVFVDHRRTASERETAIVAGVNGRDSFEARSELEWLALLDDDVSDIWGIYGFDAAGPKRFIHRPRDKAMRNVVENLIAKTLTDDLGGDLARPEAGDPCSSAVVFRYLIYLGVYHSAGDFDDEVFACVADVYEFGFHVSI
jgi:hypothetical protein